jgi:prevent-host-death family protein
MTKVSVSEARQNFADIGNRVRLRGERVLVQRRGRKLCAIMPVEDLEFMESLEDKADLEAIRKARKLPSRPWAEVKKDLGY